MNIDIFKVTSFLRQFENNLFKKYKQPEFIFLINKRDFNNIENILPHKITNIILIGYGNKEFFNVAENYDYINLQLNEYDYYEYIPTIYKKIVEILVEEKITYNINIDINLFLNNYYKLEYFVIKEKIRNYEIANKKRLITQEFLYTYLNILLNLYEDIKER